MHSPAVRARAMELIQAGHNDCEVSRRTGIPRTTIRDWRRPRYQPRPDRPPIHLCPRCWSSARGINFDAGDYAELLGLYLGDGYLVRMPRTWRLRIYLDSRHEEIVRESIALLRRSFTNNTVQVLHRHGGAMTILSLYSSHLACLFPQHGAGKKHERAIRLEDWQESLVSESPWRFLKGCIWSDGCSYINRTGPYEYLSYEFFNYSPDIIELFCTACDVVGVEYRRYARRIRIYRRPSVALMEANVGVKR